MSFSISAWPKTQQADRAPVVAPFDEGLAPAALAQQHAGNVEVLGHQQCTVLVEHRRGIAQCAAAAANAVALDDCRLQRIEPGLGARHREPHQSVEEIVRIEARRNAAGRRDVGFVGTARRRVVGGRRTRSAGRSPSSTPSRATASRFRASIGSCAVDQRTAVRDAGEPRLRSSRARIRRPASNAAIRRRAAARRSSRRTAVQPARVQARRCSVTVSRLRGRP